MKLLLPKLYSAAFHPSPSAAVMLTDCLDGDVTESKLLSQVRKMLMFDMIWTLTSCFELCCRRLQVAQHQHREQQHLAETEATAICNNYYFQLNLVACSDPHRKRHVQEDAHVSGESGTVGCKRGN